MASWTCISEAAVAVLSTANAFDKANIARAVAHAWFAGDLPFEFETKPADRPARPNKPALLPPGQMPKRRKAGSTANKIALIHAVAHIELNAIDLAFDIVARFGEQMPRGFTDDWIKVGDDEARHFQLLEGHLNNLDSRYGDLDAHDGLWQSAEATAADLPARLAIVPMVLEARGLDVTPTMIDRFERFGDSEIAKSLNVIYTEEITHVEAGTRWFNFLADKAGENREDFFQTLVQKYFKGLLKRPFNEPARTEAGLLPSFYEPLVLMLEENLTKV